MLNVKTYPRNDALEGLCRLERDIVFSTETGTELKLQLVLPEAVAGPFPVLVFVQGSAWTFPGVDHKLPMLSAFACAGIACATITHRSSLDGHPFPAFLEDTKTAIRFLRANAEKYRLDPDRVGIWGTSSGGNTALLCGVTGDDPRYKTGEYGEFSDSVKAVADCFGPTDMMAMGRDLIGEEAMKKALENPGSLDAIAMAVLNTGDPLRAALEMSPINYVEPGKDLPPFLLLHGDADPIVPYEQSVIMGEKLLECGCEVELIRVEGGVHEGNFWNPVIYDELVAFFKKHL